MNGKQITGPLPATAVSAASGVTLYLCAACGMHHTVERCPLLKETPGRISEEDVERIARRVAELLK